MIVFRVLIVLLVSVRHSRTVLTEFAVKTLKCNTLYGNIFRTSNIRYFPQCVQLCELNEYCLSVLYSETDGICRYNSQVLPADTVTEDCGQTLKYAERRNFCPTSLPCPATNTSTSGPTTTTSTSGPTTTTSTSGSTTTTSTLGPTTTTSTSGSTTTTSTSGPTTTTSTSGPTTTTSTSGSTTNTSTSGPTTTTSTSGPTTTTSTSGSTTTTSTSGPTTTGFVIEKSLIEKPCLNANGCDVINSACIEGVCRCVPGYSYDSNIVLCVANCGMYGTAFQFHPNSILLHIERTFTDVSEYQCTEECINEDGFVCRTLDYHTVTRTCHLSSVTAASEPESFAPYNDTLYRQRDCL